jgi:hypothetical protein
VPEGPISGGCTAPVQVPERQRRLLCTQAPQAPWGGPGTNIGPQNTMAMMLALLWPDIAGPLADPAFLAAAGAIEVMNEVHCCVSRARWRHAWVRSW